MVVEFPQLLLCRDKRPPHAGVRWLLCASLAAVSTTALAASPTLPESTPPGKARYLNDCAACHGVHANGQGPVAGALTTPPADLTGLARRNGGEFPTDYVRTVIDGRSFDALAHGNLEMPVWGDEYRRSLAGLSEARVKSRIEELIVYLRAIQSP